MNKRSNAHDTVILAESFEDVLITAKFAQHLFGAWGERGENLIVSLSKTFLTDYQECPWENVMLSNLGGFYFPRTDSLIQIFHPVTGFKGVFSPQAAGMVITIKALSIICYQAHLDGWECVMLRTARNLNRLNDYIAQHPEAALIQSAEGKRPKILT